MTVPQRHAKVEESPGVLALAKKYWLPKTASERQSSLSHFQVLCSRIIYRPHLYIYVSITIIEAISVRKSRGCVGEAKGKNGKGEVLKRK